MYKEDFDFPSLIHDLQIDAPPSVVATFFTFLVAIHSERNKWLYFNSREHFLLIRTEQHVWMQQSLIRPVQQVRLI